MDAALWTCDDHPGECIDKEGGYCCDGECQAEECPSCPDGFVLINGKCLTDGFYCAPCSDDRPPCDGICCDEGFDCIDGKCVEKCPDGRDKCDGTCCDEGYVCIDGKCVSEKFYCIPEGYYSSSSSSSSCYPCENISVTLTTSGCCLFLGPSGIEAVGDGTVYASMDGNGAQCEIFVTLNGSQAESMSVQDGDAIEVGLGALNEICSCCETRRQCNERNGSGVIVQKSGKENKTITINKKELARRMVNLTKNIVKRRRNLRN